MANALESSRTLTNLDLKSAWFITVIFVVLALLLCALVWVAERW
jgi:hypothetical protein